VTAFVRANPLKASIALEEAKNLLPGKNSSQLTRYPAPIGSELDTSVKAEKRPFRAASHSAEVEAGVSKP